MSHSILVVDDDRLLRSFLRTVLKEENYVVEDAESAEEGLSKILAADFDLVITDLKMPGMSGLGLMREGRKIKAETKWIIITAYGSIGNAVEAMKEGASDYLTKPLANPDELRHVVRRVLKEIESERRISLLTEELGMQYPPLDNIFLGKGMDATRSLVLSVAPTTATVLLMGASGTGKELVARVIHQLGQRKNKPFIAVHCAALVDTLLESELFGHERGAFTGAIASRKGRFEQADSGTIFLDEIGEISPSVQLRLLRVLQERQFERVGGDRLVSVDIRIIAATNKDLKAEVAAGRFREDLYYRLNVFPISLPSLAERQEAIIPLTEYFTAQFAVSLGKNIKGVTEQVKLVLLDYSWPGNIRELKNVIERAVILSNHEIREEHLSLEQKEADHSHEGGLIIQAERGLVIRTLNETGGNRKKAAEKLGISLRTLQYRIKEFKL